MKLSHVLRAVASSWLAMAVNAAVGFLLTPYVLHHLGDVEFGLYTLVTTLIGYYGLFDLGVRSAILRFASRSMALNDRDEVNRVLSSAFYFYWAMCLLSIFATLLLLPWLPRLFAVSGETAHAFQYLFLLAGIVQGLTFPLNVFAATLDASGRFDQVYMVQTLSLLIRVVLVIGAIRAGGHLLAVGAVVLLSIFLSYVLQVPFALHQIRPSALSPKWLSKASLREMFRYASVTIGVNLGGRLKASAFPILVGLTMDPVAVTLFSLPTRLLRFPIDGVSTMSEVVNPAASHLEARGDYGKLRELLLSGVQGTFLVLAPMSAFLFIYGRDFLRLWVGSAYLSAYPLLVLLTIGMGCDATQSCIQSMLFGIGKHKGLIFYRFFEGGTIIILGGLALKLIGLLAFASVIAATLMLTSLILIPKHLCQILGMPLTTYLTEACLKPCILVIPCAAALFAVHRGFRVNSWIGLLSALGASGIVYLGTLSWAAFRRRARPGNQLFALGVLDVLAERARPILAKVGVTA